MRLEHTYTICKLHSKGKRNLKKHYYIKIIILSIKSKKGLKQKINQNIFIILETIQKSK